MCAKILTTKPPRYQANFAVADFLPAAGRVFSAAKRVLLAAERDYLPGERDFLSGKRNFPPGKDVCPRLPPPQKPLKQLKIPFFDENWQNGRPSGDF